MINWQYYPKSDKAPDHMISIVNVFEKHEDSISSDKKQLESTEVLSIVRNELLKIDFEVEKGKRKEERIQIPVLFGRNGKCEKFFEADAFNEKTCTVLEVEAGRGVTNYQFLKDLFEACMMYNIEYLAIAIRKIYRNRSDFNQVTTFFDTLYASRRLELPLVGILIIGY